MAQGSSKDREDAARAGGAGRPLVPQSKGVTFFPMDHERARRPGDGPFTTYAAYIEWILIAVGAWLLFDQPRTITGDGFVRFQALTILLDEGRWSPFPYSLAGPLFSAPLWWLGQATGALEYWVSAYNWVLFVLFLAVSYRMLRSLVEPRMIRRFFLILISASMFPHHLKDYYGEVFSAVLSAVGILCLAVGRDGLGWLGLGLAVVNQPAAWVGAAAVGAMQLVSTRRLRHVLSPLAVALLIALESWIRRGSPLLTGYEGNHGFPTMLPYSGLPSFSYPLFFGMVSILFSFGKGLVFFAPGLLVLGRDTWGSTPGAVRRACALALVFLAGMVLVYSKWWAWYGGFFWGPRFFLFASIPASFVLALQISNLSDPVVGTRSAPRLLLILGALALSAWVGFSGMVFMMDNLEVCSQNDYMFEHLCWHVPEFSVLFRPFVVRKAPSLADWRFLIYCVTVFILLALPLILRLGHLILERWSRFLRDLHPGDGRWQI